MRPKKLRKLASQHNLCMGLLGLEDRTAHDQRLHQALIDLKIHIWPFVGAIDVVEQEGYSGPGI